MADLFKFVDSDCSPSCKEQNFTIQDEDTLAQHVAELLMGQYGARCFGLYPGCSVS